MDYGGDQQALAQRVGHQSLLPPALAIYAICALGVGICIAYELLLWGLFFTVLALAMLYVIHDEFYQRVFESADTSRLYLVAGLVAYAAGAVIVSLTVVAGSAGGTLIGTWTTAAGLAAVVAGARYLTSEPKERTWIWVLAGFSAAGIFLLSALLLAGSDVWFAIAILAALLSATVGVIAMRWMCRRDARLWSAVGLAVSLIGIAFVGISFYLPVEPVVWLGVFLLVLGLGLVPLSFAAPSLTRAWPSFGLPVAVAIGMAAGAWLVVAADGDLSLTALFFVLAVSALIAAAFVWQGFEMVPIIILGIAMAWVVFDRTDAVVEPEPVEAVEVVSASGPNRTLIAIGDSYMSGEGATRYLEGTNIKATNECRRSSTAYPQLVAEHFGWDLEFYACSGAVAANVLTTGQQEAAPDHIPQIENLDAFLGPNGEHADDVGAVLVSIGGNDAWFGAIAQACVAPGNCAEHRSIVLRNVRVIGERMRLVYEEIRARVHPAPVIAMPYPLVFADQSCDDSPVSAEELTFLIEFTEVLNDRVRTSAAQAGINYFDGGAEAFVGRRICDTDSGHAVVNVTFINPQEGSLFDRLNALNWFHGSAHPKPTGHRLMANRLIEWMDTVTGNPDPDPVARFEILLPSQRTRVSTRILGIPADLACGLGELPVSALSQGLASDEVDWSYPSGMPASPVCFTRSDGTWSVGELSADDKGGIVVPALPPDEGWTQTIVYQNVFGNWNVQVLEHCEPDPDCAHDRDAVGEWTVDEARTRLKQAAAPIFLVFLGVWASMVAAKRAWLEREDGGTQTSLDL